jgi:hypothetical protein
VHYAVIARPAGQGWRLLIDGVGTAWSPDLWEAPRRVRKLDGITSLDTVSVYADLVSLLSPRKEIPMSETPETTTEVVTEPEPVSAPEVDEPENSAPVIHTTPVPEDEPQHLVQSGASNVSPTLPPGAQAAAARAHIVYGKIAAMAQAVQADLERYIPAGFLQNAESEANELLRDVL